MISGLQASLEHGVISRRAGDLFAQYQLEIHKRTDRLFAGLMGFQWIAGIIFALWVSPLAWSGTTSRTHLHVWAAVFLGGAICLFPALLGLLRPGEASTRYTIAVAQMLMGALLIHLTGGRIETHFHVFGSLAFLAFYRDWRVLIPATVVVALDHLLRGMFWPQSVYGVLVASQWRWLEHAAWVVFEDVFLIVSCQRSVVEMKDTARRTAALEQEVRTRQQAENVASRAADDLATLVEELRITQRRAEAATHRPIFVRRGRQPSPQFEWCKRIGATGVSLERKRVLERARVEQQFRAQPVGQCPAGSVLEHLVSQATQLGER